MKDLYYKYAELLLKKGLCIKKKQPLVINAPIESIDFIRVLTEVACKLGVKEIYYDWYDDELKHTILKYYAAKDIKKSTFWNKNGWYVMGGKSYMARIFADAGVDYIMKDIDDIKLKVAAKHSLKTRKTYREMQGNNEVSWCIASVATTTWGKLLFPNSKTPKEDLWNLIFDICHIKEDKPLDAWTNIMKKNKSLFQLLIKLNYRIFHIY